MSCNLSGREHPHPNHLAGLGLTIFDANVVHGLFFRPSPMVWPPVSGQHKKGFQYCMPSRTELLGLHGYGLHHGLIRGVNMYESQR